MLIGKEVFVGGQQQRGRQGGSGETLPAHGGGCRQGMIPLHHCASLSVPGGAGRQRRGWANICQNCRGALTSEKAEDCGYVKECHIPE